MISKAKAKTIAEENAPGRVVQRIMDYKNSYICSLIPKDQKSMDSGYVDDFLSVDKATGKCSPFQPFRHMDFIMQQNQEAIKNGVPVDLV